MSSSSDVSNESLDCSSANSSEYMGCSSANSNESMDSSSADSNESMSSPNDNSNESLRADNWNLPELDLMVICEYACTFKPNSAEIRELRALEKLREGFVDDAVGFVAVKRVDSQCTVKAKVANEDETVKKCHCVLINYDEKEKTVTKAKCSGCPALEGGCKHILILLMWLDKRNRQEPEFFRSYWKRPKLASKETKPMTLKEMFNVKKSPTPPPNPSLLDEFLNDAKKRNVKDSLLLQYQPNYDRGLLKYSIFNMGLDFTDVNKSNREFEVFKGYMENQLNKEIISGIEQESRNRNSNMWHTMQQYRILDSKIYDAAHYKGVPGQGLIEHILGGYKMYQTKFMKKRKALKKSVMEQVAEHLEMEVQPCGFTITNLLFGVSPDGKTEEFLIEVKLASRKKPVTNYAKEDKVKVKYFAQCQIQMLATGYQKCAMVVADPEFRENKKFEMFLIEYDDVYAKNLLLKAEPFWKEHIFPKLMECFQCE